MLHETQEKKELAILVAVQTKTDKYFAIQLEELANLALACNIPVLDTVTQNLPKADATTYLGKGKLQELKVLLQESEANLIIFNTELTPSQLKNIENILECKIIDRTMLILEIFQRRAQTKEAMLQVAIAELQYFLPRLVGLRTSLGRQSGGVGTKNKGLGEKKIDLDRRKIEHEIKLLKKELQEIVGQRQTQRKWRKRSGTPTLALVGYTNAGKSTLMNTILEDSYHPGQTSIQKEKLVFTKDMLFATLETSSRKIYFDATHPCIITDTVGFISKLPHHLVNAFKSTLEEIQDAHLILHVIDASDPHREETIKITEQVLASLGAAEIPKIYVYNKIDTEHPPIIEDEHTFCISAKTKKGIPELLQKVVQTLYQDEKNYLLQIPYTHPEIAAYYHQNTAIINEAFEENYIHLTVRSSEKQAYKFKDVLTIKEIEHA